MTKQSDLIPELRGVWQTHAEEGNALPSRFVCTPVSDAPRMSILDSNTGKAIEVGLCDYKGAREALAAFA